MARASRKSATARKKTAGKKNPVKRAASSAKKVVKAAKKKVLKKEEPKVAAPKPARPRSAPKQAARPPKREPDIPLDRIERAYTPKTSVKAGFRKDGSDQQRDQEFAGGVDDDRWKDEDRITNKSGDPRIGTHGRTYEPAEKKTKIDYETE
jgi:hypothetical protein